MQFSQERSEKKVEAAASLEFHFRLLSASATAAGPAVLGQEITRFLFGLASGFYC